MLKAARVRSITGNMFPVSAKFLFFFCFRSREHVIQNVLQHHVTLNSEGEEDRQREDFLTQKLHLPTQWIHQAKVWHLRYSHLTSLFPAVTSCRIYSKTSNLISPTGLSESGLNYEIVLFLTILNVKHTVIVLLESGLHLVVWILRWMQSEAALSVVQLTYA